MTEPEPATILPAPFDHALWTEILAAIVTPEGKVDYEILVRHRDLLTRFVVQLGTASPDTTPARFPTAEHALAYWINAYNAFVLAAVIEEYPIRSVWKVRDGQFFTRVRHLAGDTLLSLNDIEHRILRGRFREPRIHFALNCASNGCPPMRPQAFAPDGIRQTLRTATQQFLASEWNCRIDRAQQKTFVSRLFRMYAADFVGEADSTAEYRCGVLQFVAEHTGEPSEAVAETYRKSKNLFRPAPKPNAARRSAAWTGRADSVRVTSQRFPRARASGRPVLERWRHFEWLDGGTRVRGLSPIGRATIIR